MPPQFVHLHLHSTASRLDGMITAEALMEYCQTHGMTAVGLTDHGNLSGAIEFYVAARERGINPILGIETYVVDDHTQTDGPRYHEGLLAMHWEGYKNLVKLSTLGFTQGLRRSTFACIDEAQIEQYNAGLICLSGCISSRLARILMGGLERKEALIEQADQALVYAQNGTAFNEARVRARRIATQAAGLVGPKKAQAILEAQELHAFLDQVAGLVATDQLEAFVQGLHEQANALWQQTWGQAQALVQERHRVFGDRYYLETQVTPSPAQQTYNGFIRQLAAEYDLPIVVTSDCHYLREADADLHRQMLRIRTEKRASTTKKEVVRFEFPPDQAEGILTTDGSHEELSLLYDQFITAQSLRKVRLETKAHAERRKKWVGHAQIFFLQNQGEDAELLEQDAEAVSIDAIDPGRSFADWEAQFWVRTPQEMLQAGALPAEMAQTVALAARCDLRIPLNHEGINPGQRIVHMPQFPLPDPELDHDQYLAQLAVEGLRVYCSEHPRLDEARYASRLYYELSVIREAGFSNYFLIVWDYINYIRGAYGLSGPARGSSAASLTTFLLGITKRIDPLQYPDLMFERFLTPGRPDLPDIDTDFDYASAERVFDYCASRYGADRVCKIGTFSTIGVRQALQDLGRVLGIPYLDVEKAATTLRDFKPEDEQVLDDNKALFDLTHVTATLPELGTLRDTSPLHAQWFDYANRLTGTRRNASQHASGVAIAEENLVELGIPLMVTVTLGKQAVITTQYGMDDLALLGIPKFDQLKLSNLNILADTEQLIGDDFTIDEIPLADQATYAALSRGDNLAIFQMGQTKTKQVLRAVQPKSLGDIASIITVIRPGLLARDAETGLTMEELFRARAQDSLPVKYLHPFLEPITKGTYGIALFQEQILKILNACGFDPLSADKLRKALGKKKMSEAQKFEGEFITGAIREQQLTQAQAQELWDLIVEFAAYSFNCLIGSTRVERPGKGRFCSDSTISIDELYQAQQSDTSWGEKIRAGRLGLLALGSDGRIRPAPLKRVIATGKQPVLRVETQSGYSVTGTLAHRLLTPQGYQRIGALTPGDQLIIQGPPEPYHMKTARSSTRHTSPKPYRGGFRVGHANPAWVDGRSVAYANAVELVTLRAASACEQCGIPDPGGSHGLEYAHLDTLESKEGNWAQYNSAPNIRLLCNPCHKRLDYAKGERKKRWSRGLPTRADVIVSLTMLGEQETYDIEMDSPEHNFIANGIVSHNSAHAYAYGLITYWTAYLKTHYPAQFMAATLTMQSQKTSKAARALIPRLLEDCGQMGRDLPILAPSVNHSQANFSIEYLPSEQGLRPAIRYGLCGIKGVGSLADVILLERAQGRFLSFEDFDTRVSQRRGQRAQKNVLDALAYAGAFDEFFAHRSHALHAIECARAKTKALASQLAARGVVIERKARLDQRQAELCGNYYFVKDNLEVLGQEVDNFFEAVKGERLTIGGRVLEVKLDKKTQRGAVYHRAVLKTQWGDVNVDFYPPKKSDDPATYLQKLKEKLFHGAVVLISGSVRDDRSMWGHSLALPAPLYRGESHEDPIKLAHEAKALLESTAI